MKMKMEVMSTHSAALQHPTPPPSHCPGATDTSLIADISHKQKIGLLPTLCHRWGNENLRLSYTLVECWRVQAAAQLQSDGRLQARDTGPVFASALCKHGSIS